jgi:hypothetical protein
MFDIRNAFLLRATAATVATVWALGGLAAQEARPERVQQPTEEGQWHGTWTYINRDEKMILWIDDSGDQPRVKVQYISSVTPEAFVTDWNGSVTYELAGEQATFHLDVIEGDDDRIEGNWLWDIQWTGAGRTERGVFSLYRVSDGRQLMIDFSEYDKAMRRGSKVSRYSGPASWNFKKVSKRHALWQEVF